MELGRSSEKGLKAVAEGETDVDGLLQKRQIRHQVILLVDLVCETPVPDLSMTFIAYVNEVTVPVQGNVLPP